MLIDRLTKRGIHVSTALSTDKALDVLQEQDFGAVVTDMGRKEGLRFVADAGLQLLKKVKEERPDLGVVVYTSPGSVAKYQQAALSEGAPAIAASPTELLEALGLF